MNSTTLGELNYHGRGLGYLHVEPNYELDELDYLGGIELPRT